MKTAISFFIVLILLPSLFAQEKKTSIAVLEFQSGGSLDKTEINTLTNRFRGLLVKTQAFNVVERERLNEILKAQDFIMSDACNTAECAVQVGQLLGVESMIAGDIGKLGETYTVDIRLIDVQSGGIIQSETMDYQGKVDGLLGVLKNLADGFAGKVGVKAQKKFYHLDILARIPRPNKNVKLKIDVDGQSTYENPLSLVLPEGIHTIKVESNSPDYADSIKEINLSGDRQLEIILDYSLAYKKKIADEEVKKQAVIALANQKKTEREKAEREKAASNKIESKGTNKKLWYIIGGAAILGGGAAVLLSGGSGKGTTKIPDPYLPPVD